jgi:hypothetical protein
MVTDPMRALNFLVGNWKGVVDYRNDQSQRAFWNAQVHYNLGGNILLIDETGHDIENRDHITKKILVVIYWDPAASEYLAELFSSSAEVKARLGLKARVQGHTFVLQTNDSSPPRRFTIWLDEEGQWHEVGEVSQDDGESWKQRFEMTLNRQD